MRLSTVPIARITGDRDILGESPVWSPREQALYWVDIRRSLLRRYRPGDPACEQWDLGETPGSVALRAAGGTILSLRSGMATVSAGEGIRRQAQSPEADRPEQRFNDGRCDPRGRFWVGTMSDVARVPTGSLYRVEADWTSHRVLSGIIVPNSLCWSPCGRRMYFADTFKAEILVFDYDADSGAIHNSRVFVSMTNHKGRPDGSTVDSQGFLWNAEFDGWCVRRYAPDGRLDRTVELPVQCPTSCAFGGHDLRTLFVTTARHRLTAAEQEAQPLAGVLLAFEAGVAGLPEAEFAG
jgi:sugar lactone lactonase YvrE